MYGIREIVIPGRDPVSTVSTGHVGEYSGTTEVRYQRNMMCHMYMYMCVHQSEYLPALITYSLL